MGRDFQDFGEAMKEFGMLYETGRNLRNTINLKDYESLGCFWVESVRITQILGKIDKRGYQLAAVHDFRVCYCKAVDQKINGETFLALAKRFKVNAKVLNDALQSDLETARIEKFYDHRVIRWVERWEDVCEFLKEYCEEMYANFFGE